MTLHGNGFIAAFVAGIAFGARLDAGVADVERTDELPELLGEVLALAVWFLFGAVLVPVAFDSFSVSILVYALLSLTLIRCVPVAISLIGSGLDRQTVLFVGWFGPRGLASVVFTLLAVEELGEGSAAAPAVAAVAFTVLLSVIFHGVSAGPLAAALRAVPAAPGPGGRRSPVATLRGSPGSGQVHLHRMRRTEVRRPSVHSIPASRPPRPTTRPSGRPRWGQI